MPARHRRFLPRAPLTAAFAAALAAALLPGCAAPPRLVHMAPPAVRGETRPPRPAPGYVWVPGRWEWKDGRHEWARGHWIRGKPGKTWVPGHWRRIGEAWTWVPGRWGPV